MFGLHVIDIIVIVAYFAILLVIGYRAMKRIRNQEDFLGGRRFGRWIRMFAGLGQATSLETAATLTTQGRHRQSNGTSAARDMRLDSPPCNIKKRSWQTVTHRTGRLTSEENADM